MLSIRQAVVFSILMQHGEGILGKFPRYLQEKLEFCQLTNIPEQMLDRPGLSIFNQYAERYQYDWNSDRDYNEIPMGQFDEKTGEPKKEALEKLKNKKEE